MQLHRFFNITRTRLFLIGILTLPGAPAAVADAHSDKLRIVTDIAPIHSLVSMVVDQQAKVELLVPPGQSPHAFSLKPSQVRLINQAALIVMLSDNFTPALSRQLNSIDKNAVVLQLSDAIDEHETGNENSVPTNTHPQHLNDPHTWLNPENAIAWLDRIATFATAIDRKNKAIYENNADRAKAKLRTLHGEFTEKLAPVKAAHYIVYHDAYQHFAHSYGLQNPIAIALSDARAPGAKKLREIRLKAKQTKCVFSELLHDDIIVDTVTAGLPVKRAILDPMGSTLAIGPKHYPQMMSALVKNFVACLM